MDMFSSISSKPLPFDGHDSMGVYRDASFSSYLNGKDDNFIRKLTESARYLNPSIIPTAATPGGGGGGEDGEIGVFGAERYFNGGMDDEGSQKSTSSSTRRPPPTEVKKVDKLELGHHDHQHHVDGPMKPKPWVGTPSVVSESSSSINSQKPLLNIVRNTTAAAAATTTNNSRGKKTAHETTSKSFLSSLGYCRCYTCKDDTSVDVNEDVGEISFSNAATKPRNIKCVKKSEELSTDQSSSSFRENPFSFPTRPIMSPVKVVHFQEEEVERKSLEVFGSPAMGRFRNKQMSLEKRLAMLSWDHTNNNNNNNNNDNGGGIYNDDEVNSDCSSDLFEIESLTNKTNPFLARQPSDPLQSGCVTPTTCYEPSEASVEWSVVTASAVDFDERRPSATISSPIRVVVPRANVPKEVQKRRPGSILGCKNEKAVKVAQVSRKANERSNSELLIERRKSESSVPLKKFEDETKVGGFSFRSQGPHRALATLSLPRPYSPRLSNISFNIQ